MVVLLITHVVIAISSVLFATGLLVAPVASRFKAAYSLITATLVSGTALVIVAHSNILSACQTGIAYLVIVSALLAIARFRLAHESENEL